MPLLWLSSAFLLGILLAAGIDLPWPAWLGISLACIPLYFLEKRKFRRPGWLPLPAALILAFLLLGAARAQAAQPTFTPAHLAYYNDQGQARLTGTLAAPPDHRDSADLLTVRVTGLAFPDREPIPVKGLALVRAWPGSKLSYGQQVTLIGEVSTPPEDDDFSYRAYLERQGIYTYLDRPRVIPGEAGGGSLFWRAVWSLRQHAYRLINRFYPQPEAALVSGILLGLDQDLPADLTRAFQQTGTAHIIAISGFNMAILSALFLRVFRRFLAAGWAALLTVLALTFYTLLVGANPAVVRAAIMGAAAVFGGLLGRRQTAVNTLTFTAAVMCLPNPLLLWDAGFQLSFSATLGLVLWGAPVEAAAKRFAYRRLPREWARRLAALITEFGLLTLVAQLATLPVSLYHFQRVSLSAVLANPLVLPVQPALMILSGAGLLLGLVFAPLGQLAAALVWPLAAYTNRAVTLLANLPGGSLGVDFFPGWAALALFALLIIPRARPQWMSALKPALLLGGLALASVFVWRVSMAAPDGKLHLSLLGGDGGPAVLVRAPGGETALAGGCESARRMGEWLGLRLPYTHRRLDAALLTCSGSTCLQAWPDTLARFPAASALWLAPRAQNRAGRSLNELLADPPDCAPGTQILLDPQAGVTLRCLGQSEGGGALLVEWQSFSLLIPSGMPPANLPLDPHTASALLLGPRDDPSAWLDSAPALTVAQSDLPLPPHWQRLPAGGWLELASDGQRLWLETAP